MSRRFDRWRTWIESGVDVADARSLVISLLRRAARKVVFDYAVIHNVFDFDDIDFVEQAHRNYREQVRTQAAALAVQAQAALTVSDVLAVYDQLEAWI